MGGDGRARGAPSRRDAPRDRVRGPHGRAGRPSWSNAASPTRRPTASTCRSRRCPATACSRTSPSSRCGPGRGSRWTRRSAPRSTSCSGRRRSRASRPGTRRGGRAGPGWHTECVVMSLDLLGDGFDLHGGGIDLIFPHHENERAQAVASGHGVRPPLGPQRVGHRRRREDVEVAGQLHHARRPPRPQRRTRLPAARAALPLPLADRGHPEDRAPTPKPDSPGSTRWPVDSAWPTRSPAGPVIGEPAAGIELDEDALARFRARMDDDLDTPGALATVFDLVRDANAAADAGDDDARHVVVRRPERCSPARSVSRCTAPPKKLTTQRQRWSLDVIAPGPSGTGRSPMHYATSSSARDGSSRTARTARASAVDEQHVNSVTDHPPSSCFGPAGC